MLLPLLKRIFLKKAYQFVSDQKEEEFWQEVFVPMRKGLLHCLWWEYGKGSKGVVILIHPYHSKAKEYFFESGHPELYHNLGYDVVIFDLNGFGKSQDINFNFQQNLLRVASYFKAKLYSPMVIGHGISFGAAILLTSLQFNHNFDRAVIENCLDKVSNYYRVRNKKLQRTIQFTEFLSPIIRHKNHYFKSAESIQNIDKILLIYAEDDQLTTPEMGLRIKNHCAVQSDYHLLKGDHMESINADPEKYLSIVKNYITIH